MTYKHNISMRVHYNYELRKINDLYKLKENISDK